MVGYSEVLQSMGAMIIFSLILLSATKLIQRNTYMQVEGEMEQEVIALAQDIIEEGRTKEFDENSMGAAPPANIPGDFSASSNMGPDFGDDINGDGTVSRYEFDDFDDYNGWNEVLTTEHGSFNIRAEVFYADESTYDSTSVRSTFKKMRVYITSKFLNDGGRSAPTLYSLEFIRNYYAD